MNNENQNVIIIYTPIEFPVENDGLRSINEKERTTIDFLIKNILDTTGADYITVTGTVEERLAQIKEKLNVYQWIGIAVGVISLVFLNL